MQSLSILIFFRSCFQVSKNFGEEKKRKTAAFAGAIREFPRPKGFLRSMETLQLHVQQVSGLNMLLEVQTDTSIREVKKKLKDWQKSHLDCIDCLELKPVFMMFYVAFFKI